MKVLLVILGVVGGPLLLLQAYALLAGYFMPMEKLAGSYLRVQLRKRGVSRAVPTAFISEVAAAYANAVEFEARIAHRRRTWSLPAMNRAVAVGAEFIEAWIKKGTAVPQWSVGMLGDGERSLALSPGFLVEVLQRYHVLCGPAE